LTTATAIKIFIGFLPTKFNVATNDAPAGGAVILMAFKFNDPARLEPRRRRRRRRRHGHLHRVSHFIYAATIAAATK